MASRTRRALLAGLLAGPLAALGICGTVAPLASAAAVCEAGPTDADCCSRSGAPAPSQKGVPDRCAACGAAAFASEAAREGPRTARGSVRSVRVGRPALARTLVESSEALSLAVLAASPPRQALLATFRN